MKTLSDLAEVIRSKNAGPFIVTFDILFETQETFEAVRSAGMLSRQAVCGLYGVSDNELLGFDFYPFARAVKSGGPRSLWRAAPRRRPGAVADVVRSHPRGGFRPMRREAAGDSEQARRARRTCYHSCLAILSRNRPSALRAGDYAISARPRQRMVRWRPRGASWSSTDQRDLSRGTDGTSLPSEK